MLSVITERRDRRPDGLRVPRILVVDDEPMIVEFTIRALSRTGEYGLVIMDLVMPELDGYAMLTRLLRERPEQPVLVLSCLADVTTKVRCLELGAQDYLTTGKPVIVNFFASGCQPCKRETPLLARYCRDSGGRVVIIGVDSFLNSRHRIVKQVVGGVTMKELTGRVVQMTGGRSSPRVAPAPAASRSEDRGLTS